MADDKRAPKPRGRPPKSKFKVKKSDIKPNTARPSAETIKQLYMASPHVEWSPFARSNNWNPITSRGLMPIDEWIKQKRTDIAREQSEHISEMIFNHQSRWHKDVLKTFQEYPEANDAMLAILKKRLNDIVEIINDDSRKKQFADQTGEIPPEMRFAKIKNGELMGLAAAIKVCTESKHKSLMINDWSFKVAETFSDPKQFESLQEKQQDLAWNVKIMGGENLSSRDMQNFITRWYDQPVSPHDEATIDAQFTAKNADE